jgi:6-phosphogluconolactonase (cycloisomerase 2 family)
MSKKTTGILLVAVLAGLSLLLMSCASSSSRPAALLFVALQGANQVNSYAVNLKSGNLSYIHTGAPTGALPTTMLLDPTGASAFVLNANDDTISSYTVASNGKLSASGTTTISVQNSVSMARDSAGQFLFVVSQGQIPPPIPPATPCGVIAEPNDVCPHISAFSMQSGSTTLTPVGTPFPLNQVPTSIAASITVTVPDPSNPAQMISGPLVYVTNSQNLAGAEDNTVSEFVFDTASGTLRELFGSPYSTASNPSAVLPVNVAPPGGVNALFVYVTNTTTNQVSIYQVCITVNAVCNTADVDEAKMTPVGFPASTGQNPVALAADPTGNFLYVVNKNSATVSGFRIAQATGSLTDLNPASLSTGSSPVAVTLIMDSTNGTEFLYVSNNGSSNLSGFTISTTTGSLSNPLIITSLPGPFGIVTK